MTNDTTQPAPTKACPFCGETILLVARKCKHCRELLDSAGPQAQKLAGDLPAARQDIVVDSSKMSAIVSDSRNPEPITNTNTTTSRGESGSAICGSTEQAHLADDNNTGPIVSNAGPREPTGHLDEPHVRMSPVKDGFCPQCGSSSVTKTATSQILSVNGDRLCNSCGTQWAPAMPEWAMKLMAIISIPICLGFGMFCVVVLIMCIFGSEYVSKYSVLRRIWGSLTLIMFMVPAFKHSWKCARILFTRRAGQLKIIRPAQGRDRHHPVSNHPIQH